MGAAFTCALSLTTTVDLSVMPSKCSGSHSVKSILHYIPQVARKIVLNANNMQHP